jgi:ATP-dependent DNA ligase
MTVGELAIAKSPMLMGCEGIVSKRFGSIYRSGKCKDWLKFKNPEAPAVKREAEEDWGR